MKLKGEGVQSYHIILAEAKSAKDRRPYSPQALHLHPLFLGIVGVAPKAQGWAGTDGCLCRAYFVLPVISGC